MAPLSSADRPRARRPARMVAGVGEPRAGYGGPVPGERDPGRRDCCRCRRSARAGAGARPGRRPAPPAAPPGAGRGARPVAGSRACRDRALRAELRDRRGAGRQHPLSRPAHGGLRAGRGARAAAGPRLSFAQRVSEPVVVLPVYRTGEGAAAVAGGQPMVAGVGRAPGFRAAAPPGAAAGRPAGHGHGDGRAGQAGDTGGLAALVSAMAPRRWW